MCAGASVGSPPKDGHEKGRRGASLKGRGELKAQCKGYCTCACFMPAPPVALRYREILLAWLLVFPDAHPGDGL